MNNLNDFQVKQKEIYAIHLDDHRMFRKGLKIYTDRIFDHFTMDEFEHPEPALNKIQHCLENNITIDLIISDIRHPEPNGFEFSKLVREMEKVYHKRIPILIISMYISEPLWPKIIEFLDCGIWDKVLPKSLTEEDFLGAINEILGH